MGQVLSIVSNAVTVVVKELSALLVKLQEKLSTYVPCNSINPSHPDCPDFPCRCIVNMRHNPNHTICKCSNGHTWNKHQS